MKYLPIIIVFSTTIGCNTELNNDTVNKPLTTVNANEQNTQFVIKPFDTLLYKGWTKHIIKDIGFIYTPNEYTFYDENSYDSVSKSIEPNASSKGVILENEESDSSYVKIIITTKMGNKGVVHKLSNTPYYYKPLTINDYELMVKPKIISQNETAGMTIINSTKVAEFTLNDIFCIGFSMQGTHPFYADTLNSKYFWINNNDRVHLFNLGYTSNYYKKNKDVVDKIIESFRITNIQ
ncbi:MAG: hypothetical protein LC111_02120 [Bacteroidia bacterium]|nr:hypothetical protein [Bacteroidia bacterium]